MEKKISFTTIIFILCVGFTFIDDFSSYIKSKKIENVQSAVTDAKTSGKKVKTAPVTNNESIKKNKTGTKTTPTPTNTSYTIKTKPVTSKAPSVPKSTEKKSAPVKKELSPTEVIYKKFTSPDYKDDIFLKSIFDDYNNKYFNNLVKVDSISFTDFSKLPWVKESQYDTLMGETIYSTDYGIFIIMNKNFQNDIELCRKIIAHEMIHAYIDITYIINNPSKMERAFYNDQNINHKGIYKEIEQRLAERGFPIYYDYIHTSDENYAEKYLNNR